MTFRLTRVLTVGGAAAAVAAITMTSALAAAPKFTVVAGNAAAGTSVAVKGDSGGQTPQITFVDTTSNTTLNCDSSALTGQTTVGTNLAGAGIAKIYGGQIVFTNCTGPLGLQFAVTGHGSWPLNATAPISGGVSGTVTNINATVSDPGTCTFNATGSLSGKFINGTAYSQLISPGTSADLTVSGVPAGQCFGAINNGDKASFKATYKVRSSKAAQNPLNITSP